MIGATTENPSFEVIGPLLSRSRVIILERLDQENIKQLVESALKDKEKGLGNARIKLEPEALKLLLENSNGDARTTLNALEIAANLTQLRLGERKVTVKKIEQALGS